ncbi:helix-turn-helix domain-containing protein [Kitasatospora sp. NPDC057692]|uniref:helix-turn-helix domain-containing protein n=1 Tax=Kitasatospora sp. NPDC057692 TaxID=3346215 RepID=UPI003697A527
MVDHSQAKRRTTLTGSRPSSEREPEGAIAGHLFKVIREQIPRTQEELAEELGVDKSTLQGWESGRRPLSSTKAGNLVAMRRRLMLLGGPPGLVDMLATAMDADLLLGEILGADTTTARLREHPLAGWVLTRDTTHMIGWAVSGVLPGVVAPYATTPIARRGPVSSSPLLEPALRARFFQKLRSASEAAERAGPDSALLRRQAWYLSSYDSGWDASDWFEGSRRRGALTATAGWSPHWAEARSVAASLARQGDPTLLRDFIERSIANHDRAEAANLNYWAHWLGLDRRPQRDDCFMTEHSRPAWDASALLRELAVRLDRAVEYTDLYVHSVWALILSRRNLVDSDPYVARELAGRVGVVLDDGALSSESRRKLECVYYGLRASGYSVERGLSWLTTDR